MMSAWQIEREIAHQAATKNWPDAPSAAILAGGAFVSASKAEASIGKRLTPFAAVHRTLLSPDREHPERYSEAIFDVEIAVENWAVDPWGSGPVEGAVMESVGQSGGRGSDEVLDEVRSLLDQLVDGNHGFQGEVTEADHALLKAGSATYVVNRFQVRAYNVPCARFYHPAIQFKGTAGSQQASFTWALPPIRYDFLKVQLIRKAGSSPPVSVSDGTDLGVSAQAVSFTDVVGSSGTFSWSLFVSYDERNPTPTTAQRWSAPATATLTI